MVQINEEQENTRLPGYGNYFEGNQYHDYLIYNTDNYD